MAEPTGGAGPEVFVPTTFADLRRSTRTEGDRVLREPQAASRENLGDLVSNGDFMKTSRLVGIGALVVGALLILGAYLKPMFDTADAVQTAAATAADKAKAQLGVAQGTVSGIAGRAEWVKSTDMKAIDTAKAGVACLNGQSACANSARTPF